MLEININTQEPTIDESFDTNENILNVDFKETKYIDEYQELKNLPKINGVELIGNKTSKQLNIKQNYTANDIPFTDGETFQEKYNKGELTGPQGPQGNPGQPGKDGVNGKDGLPGKDGINGKDGKDGLPGPQGEPGKNGVNGKNGEPGKQGPEGKPGTTIYKELNDKPSINGVVLEGNKTTEQLKIKVGGDTWENIELASVDSTLFTKNVLEDGSIEYTLNKNNSLFEFNLGKKYKKIHMEILGGGVSSQSTPPITIFSNEYVNINQPPKPYQMILTSVNMFGVSDQTLYQHGFKHTIIDFYPLEYDKNFMRTKYSSTMESDESMLGMMPFVSPTNICYGMANVKSMDKIFIRSTFEDPNYSYAQMIAGSKFVFKGVVADE